MFEVGELLEKYNQIDLGFANYIEEKRLYPIVKWAGGKEQELKKIIPNLPLYFENYYEPFVGGGAVYTALQAKHYYINDRSEELIDLYINIANKENELFFEAIDEIIHNWDLLSIVVYQNHDFFLSAYKNYSTNKVDTTQLKNILFEFILNNSKQFNGMFSTMFNFNIENFIKEIKINLIRKIKRMKQLEGIRQKLPDSEVLDNIETAFKSAFYMHFRHIYNNRVKYKLDTTFKSAIFLFIRNYAYSGMFRYNLKGDFNVPYGGIGYNRKNFAKKVTYLRSKELKTLLRNTSVYNLDFQSFLQKSKPKENDFIFLDPPYDSEFSTYANNEFNRNDQIRLSNYLKFECKAKWMLIIKNTEFISNLYFDMGFNIHSFDKKYLVSFMNRNDKNAEHLLITNY